MFGFGKKKDNVPAVHPFLIRQWAESLGTMIYDFKLCYIGADRNEAMRQIRESWHGSEVSEVDTSTFAVRHKERLEPFVFFFKSMPDGDGKVGLMMVEANPPFANILIATDQDRNSNYLIKCPPEQLNKQEKKLCQALEKHENIPRGRWSNDSVSVPPNAFQFTLTPR